MPPSAEKSIRYQYGTLFSPWINFDEGNIAEGPVYGNWGILNMATIGGYMQDFGQGPGATIHADFNNIAFTPAPSAVALLGLGGLIATRRRR